MIPFQPSCRTCLHFKRMSNGLGQCWESSAIKVPRLVYEHHGCSLFVDQLANRAVEPPVSGPQADGDDGSTSA